MLRKWLKKREDKKKEFERVERDQWMKLGWESFQSGRDPQAPGLGVTRAQEIWWRLGWTLAWNDHKRRHGC